MSDVHESLAEIVGAQHVLDGDAIGDDYTHDEALGVTPHRPPFVVRPADTDEVAARRRASPASTACPSRRAARAPGCRARASRRRRHPRVVRADEPRSSRSTPRTTSPSSQPGVTLDAARQGHRRARARVPGVPRRELGQPRRQRRHQRRRDARREVRRDAPSRARARRGARHRRGDPHRRQVRQGDERLRPHPADHRSEGTLAVVTEATLQAATRGPPHAATRARAVRHARRGHRGGAEDRRAAASAR